MNNINKVIKNMYNEKRSMALDLPSQYEKSRLGDNFPVSEI